MPASPISWNTRLANRNGRWHELGQSPSQVEFTRLKKTGVAFRFEIAHGLPVLRAVVDIHAHACRLQLRKLRVERLPVGAGAGVAERRV